MWRRFLKELFALADGVIAGYDALLPPRR